MHPAPAAPTATTYRPDIDGMRALAIIAVMLYHAGWGATGGFVGVDVFFVISGFLIGSQLLAEMRTGRIDLVDFWERRARRIVPALTLMLLGATVAGAFFLLPPDFSAFGWSLAAQAVFVSNHYFAAHTGYFGPEAIMMPLMHTWSLAVEEQFYLVVPLLLLVLAKLPRRLAALAFVALCAVSLLYSVHAVHHAARSAYYFTASRAWELGLGVIIAGCPPLRLGRALREVLGVAGLGTILVAATRYTLGTPFPGLAALLPCGGAACLIVAGRSSPTAAGRLLSLPPLVFVGRISYSLYLWHWPAIALASYVALGRPGNLLMATAYLGALGVAIVSWHYVEMPFRARTWVPARGRYFGLAGASCLFLCALGLLIHERQGWPGRMPGPVVQYASGRTDWPPEFQQETTLAEAQSGQFIPVGSRVAGAPVDFFVWGDSHAMTLLSELDALGRSHERRGYAAARRGIEPWVDFAADDDHADEPAIAGAVVAFVRSHRIPNVILISRWGYRSEAAEDLGPEYRAAQVRTFAALHAAGARVWVVEDVPLLPWRNLPQRLARLALAGADVARLVVPAAPYLKQRDRQIREFTPLLGKDDRLLDPSSYLMRHGALILEHEGWSVFCDDNHLSTHGARLLQPMFEPLFAR